MCWILATTRRAATLTNALIKTCPISVVRTTASIFQEAPNASARPDTNFALIRKLAKVISLILFLFLKSNIAIKYELAIIDFPPSPVKISMSAPKKTEAAHTSASISKVE